MLNSGMDTISYKGYGIRPAPMELADDGGWNLEVYITGEEGGSIRRMKFFAANTFPTEEEAIQHCYEFAKRIIDHRGNPFDGAPGPLEFKP